MVETKTELTMPSQENLGHANKRKKANTLRRNIWRRVAGGGTLEANTGSPERVGLELRPSSLAAHSDHELRDIAEALNLEFERNHTSSQVNFHDKGSGYDFILDNKGKTLTSTGHFDMASAQTQLKLASLLGYSAVRPTPSISRENNDLLNKGVADLAHSNPSSCPELLPTSQNRNAGEKLNMSKIDAKELSRIAQGVGIGFAEGKTNESRQAAQTGAGSMFTLTRNGLTFNGTHGQKFDKAATTGASLLQNIRFQLKEFGHRPDSIQLNAKNPKGLNEAIAQKMQGFRKFSQNQAQQQNSSESEPSRTTAPTLSRL